MPAIVNGTADTRFREHLRAMQIKPGKFSDDYVEYEWHHARHIYSKYLHSTGKGLEFGCHLGASAVVLALMEQRVTAVDINERYCRLTELNADRYGVADRIDTICVPDTTSLPFADASFDWVSCNSVLEYVPSNVLPRIQKEIMRVLRWNGLIFVLGTSNRLWPYEIHSRRWCVNYLSDALFPGPRGTRPVALRKNFEPSQDLQLQDCGRLFVQAKAEMGMSPLGIRTITAAGRLAAAFGLSIGMLMPNICMVLRKQTRAM
jgi:SAM-dependent methyltransferase